jgi:hypothetical protein
MHLVVAVHSIASMAATKAAKSAMLAVPSGGPSAFAAVS